MLYPIGDTTRVTKSTLASLPPSTLAKKMELHQVQKYRRPALDAVTNIIENGSQVVAEIPTPRETGR